MMKFFLPAKYKSLTDLVVACQKQDKSAQSAFYDRYKGRLTTVCRRYARTIAEADDIFQEAFIKIFRNIGDIKDAEATDAWVKSVVIRTAINYYQRTTRREEQQVTVDAGDPLFEPEDYERIIDQLTLEALLDVINELPDGYRTIINLHLIDGYTHPEIASLLGISDATSRSQFMRGRNLLLKKLEMKGIYQHENF